MPRVLVIGLGLIGGSVALALRAHGIPVRGVTRSEETLRTALELQAVEGGSLRLEAEVPGAELILLAAPVRTSIRLLDEIAPLSTAGTIITDACSSKAEVVREMGKLPEHLTAVGGHPMAGRETAGILAASNELFGGATWALTETARTDDTARRTCECLAALCGAEPLWVDAEEHDRAVAAISHLPLLTAAALVLAAEGTRSELVWRLASSGFRDTTRVAKGDVQMGTDMLLTNAAAVTDAYQLFGRHLNALVSAAQDGDGAVLGELLERAAARRRLQN